MTRKLTTALAVLFTASLMQAQTVTVEKFRINRRGPTALHAVEAHRTRVVSRGQPHDGGRGQYGAKCSRHSEHAGVHRRWHRTKPVKGLRTNGGDTLSPCSTKDLCRSQTDQGEIVVSTASYDEPDDKIS